MTTMKSLCTLGLLSELRPASFHGRGFQLVWNLLRLKIKARLCHLRVASRSLKAISWILISQSSLYCTPSRRHFESLKKFYYYTASQTVCVFHVKKDKKYLGFWWLHLSQRRATGFTGVFKSKISLHSVTVVKPRRTGISSSILILWVGIFPIFNNYSSSPSGLWVNSLRARGIIVFIVKSN